MFFVTSPILRLLFPTLYLCRSFCGLNLGLYIHPEVSLIPSSFFSYHFKLFVQWWRIHNLLLTMYYSKNCKPFCGLAVGNHYPRFLWPSMEISVLLVPASVRQHKKKIYDLIVENVWVNTKIFVQCCNWIHWYLQT